MRTGHNNCEFGVLPGTLSMNVMKPAGSRWTTAAGPGDCQLQNLLDDEAKTGHVKVMVSVEIYSEGQAS
jgi:hypothetical protein